MPALGIAAFWWWLIAAILLGIGEIVAPGVFLIWLGAAALLTGVVTWAIEPPLLAQVVLFSFAAITAVYAARRWFQRNPVTSPDPLLNDRAARLIGMKVLVVASGRVRVGDGMWNAAGADAVPGETVRVIGADGTTLIIERIRGASPDE